MGNKKHTGCKYKPEEIFALALKTNDLCQLKEEREEKKKGKENGISDL